MKIVLIGFMGSGKTEVARLLSEKLNLEFIDMDDLVLEKSSRKTINEIFNKDGEKYFRELEVQVAKKLSSLDNIIVSSGGGVIMNKITMNYLTKNSTVVYLKLSFDKSVERVKLKKIRPPLFKNIARAKKLFKIRQPIYESFADIIINTDNKNVNEVVDDISVKLK